MSRSEATSIGKFRFLVELGSGGMGDVFLAVAQGPKGFNKLQVIKRLRPELAQDPEFLGMFLNEARIAARLNHPNVVQTNEVSEHDDEYFIAMEYLEGQSLYAITKRAIAASPKNAPPQRMPIALHLHVLAEACEGLHYAHELLDYDGTHLGLVHRDCSPQNIFVTYEGEVKILDFGIAKAADSQTHTRTGVLKGKVPYMPPEQLDGAPIDRRADIFAIGAMIWEAATGTRLWKGLNDIQIAHRLHQRDIPAPSSFEPSVDPALEAICMKALATKPSERYQTAAELQAALDGYVNKLGGVRRRDLGKYTLQLFTDTRRLLRRKIEEELRDVVPSWKSLLSTGSGDIARGSGSGEHASMTEGEALAISSEHTVQPTIAAAPHARGGTPVSVVSRQHEPPTPLEAIVPAANDSVQTKHSTTLTVSPEGRPRSRALFLAAAGMIVLGALIVIVLRGRASSEPDQAAPTPAAPPKPAATEQTAKSKPVVEDLSDDTTKHDAAPVASTAKKPAPGVKGTATGAAPVPSTTVKAGKPPLDPGDPWQ
jgi:serine/threonine protein kinase